LSALLRVSERHRPSLAETRQRRQQLAPISATAKSTKPAAGTVHHTDRGSQYTSYEFGKALRASGLLASMGRVGSASDNAMAESVFATLKTELIYRRSWPTRHELEMEVLLPRGLLQHPTPAFPARQPQIRRWSTQAFRADSMA
jgi:transposase InsO family protein